MEQQNNLLGPPVDICTVPERGEFIVLENFAKFRGDNFDKLFLGKTEKSSKGAVLREQELLQSSRDLPIISELGGFLEARITLADIDFAKKNKVLRDEVVYIGYVEYELDSSTDEVFIYFNEEGKKCTLCMLYFRFHGRNWHADVFPLNIPYGWDASSCVLSRIPVSKSF